MSRGLCELLPLAATILEREAEAIKRAYTGRDGKWDVKEIGGPQSLVEYRDMRSVAEDLRTMLKKIEAGEDLPK